MSVPCNAQLGAKRAAQNARLGSCLIVGMCANDQALSIELEYLCDSLACGAKVVNDKAVHANQGAYVREMKIWKNGKRFGPIRCDGLFALKPAFLVAGDLDDDRGEHFEVVAVVRKDTI
jgi:hypothetical protein